MNPFTILWGTALAAAVIYLAFGSLLLLIAHALSPAVALACALLGGFAASIEPIVHGYHVYKASWEAATEVKQAKKSRF